MIWKNIEVFNVSEITESEDGNGFTTHRFPSSVEAVLSDQGKRMNVGTTGVELRFKMIGDTVKIHLVADVDEGAVLSAHLYRGSILSGWRDFSQTLFGGEGTVLTVEKAKKDNFLKEVERDGAFPFSSDVVRIVFNGGKIKLIDVEGEVEPPKREDLPRRTYLAYGSSITHGSLSLNLSSSFVSLVGEHFGTDVRNLGLAGSALMEKEVADFIADEGKAGKWDFCTLCMGINCLARSENEIRECVGYMIERVAKANPDKHVFCISPMFSEADMRNSPAPKLWRKIVKEAVKEANSDFVHYVNGLDLIGAPRWLSGDLTHPSPRGVREITKNLIGAMEKYVK